MTTDQERRSWVEVPDASDFPIQNLPFGVFANGAGVRCGVAIGDAIVDLARCEHSGLFSSTGLSADTFRHENLNVFLGHTHSEWAAVRAELMDLLDADNASGRSFAQTNELVIEGPIEMRLPIDIGDYVDFYSSEHHATNVGKIFRPDGEPLLPNWKHLPVGYHGRSGTVVVSGTDISRPSGQLPGPDGPTFGLTQKLDIELEVGFVTGAGPSMGTPVNVDDAEELIFGLCLVNDWSARDIQAWEYVPLGPFLGKSFATTMSPWIVPLEALAPFRVPAGRQDPEPLPYLQTEHLVGFDLELSVAIRPHDSAQETTVAKTSFTNMYWTMAQQLAHATVNGATVRAGDLFASGTVSGPTPGEFGSLLESTWNGKKPIALGDGITRTFLENGDTVTLRATANADGWPSIGFGDCTGTIRPQPMPYPDGKATPQRRAG